MLYPDFVCLYCKITTYYLRERNCAYSLNIKRKSVYVFISFTMNKLIVFFQQCIHFICLCEAFCDSVLKCVPQIKIIIYIISTWTNPFSPDQAVIDNSEKSDHFITAVSLKQLALLFVDVCKQQCHQRRVLYRHWHKYKRGSGPNLVEHPHLLTCI